MSAMNRDELEAIRERVDRNSHPLGDRARLLAEVDRLRAGIEALAEDCIAHAAQEGDPAEVRTESGSWADVLDVCKALLGPTEGEK